MAQKVKWKITRGDKRSVPIKLPLSQYQPGTKIMFTAKSVIDNDLTDSSAAVKKTLTDADIQSQDATNVNYLLVFNATDTNSIVPNSSDLTKNVYIGEIQVVDPSGEPTTYDDGPEIQFTVKFDVGRRVT